MTVEIRDAVPEDIPDLVAMNDEVQRWHAEAYPDDFVFPVEATETAAVFRGIIAEEGQHLILATRDGVAAGYLWYSAGAVPRSPFRSARSRLYIHHVAVRAACRRTGAGHALFAHVRAEAARLGVGEIVLDTWAANAPAQSFFAAEGFEVYRLTLRRRAD